MEDVRSQVYGAMFLYGPLRGSSSPDSPAGRPAHSGCLTSEGGTFAFVRLKAVAAGAASEPCVPSAEPLLERSSEARSSAARESSSAASISADKYVLGDDPKDFFYHVQI